MKNHRSLLVIIFLIISSFSINNLSGQARYTLTDIYYRDYDIINRTVIVFNGKPNYTIQPRVSDRQIVLIVEDTNPRDNLPLLQSIVSPVLQSIRINRNPRGDLQITISTRRDFHLKYFDLTGPEYRLVFDIYNKEFPETDREKLAFGRFYYTVGQYPNAEDLMREILASSPQLTDANYYLGKILLNRGETNQAAEYFKKVSYNDSEYIQAQMELTRLGLIDLPYSQEMEQVFLELREYFLRAGNLNRQQLMLALASSVYGNPQETEAILSRIDYDDPNLVDMINNIRLIYNNLTEGESRPPLVNIISAPLAGRRIGLIDILLFSLILIITTALIVYLITSIAWRKKLLKESSNRGPQSPPTNKDKTARERLAEKIVAEETTIKIPEPKPEPKKTPEKPKTRVTGTTTKVTPRKNVTIQKPKPVKKVKTPVKKKKIEVNKESHSSTSRSNASGPSNVKEVRDRRATLPGVSADFEDVRSELVMKLYKDGWNTDAIAKEVGMKPAGVTRIIVAGNGKKN